MDFYRDYEERMHKAMNELGIPSANHDDDPPTEISFVVRVDMLINYCQNLRDALQKVTGECRKHTWYGTDEVWGRLEKAQALVDQSVVRSKS